MACVILLFAVPVEKTTSCQQARAQKVTEFTPQQWEQRAHRLIIGVISFVVSLCDYFCLLTSLLWCKFCNLLCACLLANGCFLHQHSKQKKSHAIQKEAVKVQHGAERNNHQPLTSLFPLLWCKFCNFL